MKVLQVIKTLNVGGAELHLLTLSRELRRLGVDVIVAHLLSPPGWDTRTLHSEFDREGIRAINLGIRGWNPWQLASGLGRLIDAEQPDVVHSHLPRADFAAFLAGRVRPSIPWVCSVHDIYSRSWSGRRMLRFFKGVWCSARTVVAISQAVRDWLLDEVGLPEGLVRTIHYGIEAGRFATSGASVGPRAVVGSMGRLEERKGHDCLIRAMPVLLRDLPQARLKIAGNDPWGYAARLRSLIDDLGLDGRVELVGFRDDVRSFLDEIDVFAFASRSEGFGQVVVEAMAAGRPVVASRVPPLTEIVVEGETGCLVEANDPDAFAKKIAWLLTHHDIACRMGQRGKARVRELFSAERMASETLDVYRALANRPGGGRG